MVNEVDDLGLGRLRRVANVCDIWSHQATAVTPWLAKHLDILGDELGTHLAGVATEVPIGEFRLDIQAQAGRSSSKTSSNRATTLTLASWSSTPAALTPQQSYGWLPGCG